MKKIILIWILLVTAACSAGTSTTGATTDPSGNPPNESVCINVAASWTSSLTTSVADSNLSSDLLPLVLSATNFRNINAYLISEDDATPTTDDARWVATDSTTALNLNLDYHLQSQGNKTLTAWFKDECGAVTSTTALQKTWDIQAPTGTLKINDGDKLTLRQNNVVLLNLSATDTTGVVAYAYTLTNTPPLESDWISIEATQQLNRTIDTIELPAPLQGKKAVYAWLKDGLGQVTQLSDDIEILNLRSISEAWGNGFNIGQYSSIAVDSHDQPFIATNFKNLGNINNISIAIKDANTPDGFSFEPVDDNGTGQGTSIAIDSEDTIHAAYRDSTQKTLKYATLDLLNPGNYQFTTETIEAGGIGPSIAVDSNNKVHIAHSDLQDHIRYVTNITGNWIGERVITGGRYIDTAAPRSLAIAPNGSIHIVRYGGGNFVLEYATNASGAWTTEPITDAYVFGGHSIVVDDTGPYIAYDVRYSGIHLARFIDSEWNFTSIAPLPMGPTSMALDSQGFVHVVYYDGTLNYATNYSGTWKTMALDTTGDVGDFCDIAIDHHDRIHISYYDRTNTDLKYATTSDNP